MIEIYNYGIIEIIDFKDSDLEKFREVKDLEEKKRRKKLNL